MCGPDSREYRLLLEDQAEQLFAMTDAITERVRNLGGNDIRPIEQSGLSSSTNVNADFVDPEGAVTELRLDNQILTGSLRSAQELCQRCGDIVTASLIEVWIDDTRRRAWILFAVTRCD
jgi:starvation-inducible DNA-binding protein